MAYRRSDLQTVWPTQITKTWTERLVVPLMAFVIVGYLPLPAVHHHPWPIFAAAMGQCLAFRREAYVVTGGHAALRDAIVEDVVFAKRVKRAGLRLRVADGGGVICCRMYQTWREVRNGFAKNILAGHGDSIPFLMVSWAFHWLLYLAPWLWLAAGTLIETPGWPLWPLLLMTLGVGVRALTASFSLQRVHDAVWMPVSTLLMAVIATQSIWWRLRYGGPQWRGRTLQARSAKNGGGV
jgi:chlorobactene glucosyltransferase